MKIVLVNFRFTENPKKYKKRPALQLTPPIGRYELKVVPFITTSLKHLEKYEITISQSNKDFVYTGLQMSSKASLHKLVTIEERDVLGYIGVISEYKAKQVKSKLQRLFELSS